MLNACDATCNAMSVNLSPKVLKLWSKLNANERQQILSLAQAQGVNINGGSFGSFLKKAVKFVAPHVMEIAKNVATKKLDRALGGKGLSLAGRGVSGGAPSRNAKTGRFVAGPPRDPKTGRFIKAKRK